MATSWRYDNVEAFTVNLGTFLSGRGIDLDTDVTEVVFMLKQFASDEDVDAKVTLTLGSGIVKSLPDKLVLNFSHGDFAPEALEPGQSYQAGLGIKTASMTKFLEAEFADTVFTIVTDFIRA